MSTAERPATGLVASTIPFSVVDGPGNRFVLFLQGCNFDCIACHNPQTIPGHAPLEGHQPKRQSVEEVLAQIRDAAPFIRGVTVSGGEATQQAGFVRRLFSAIKADPELSGLTCFVDSNGACDASVWTALAPVMDGAMIDLKCFDPEIHQRMTGQSNTQILASITQLHTHGLLHEVRLLVVPGINDAPHLMERTARWLAAIDGEMRLKLIGFRAHGTRRHAPPLTEPTVEHLAAIEQAFLVVSDFSISVI